MALHDDLPLPPEKWDEIAAEFGLSPKQKEIVGLSLRNGRRKDIAGVLDRGSPTVGSHFKTVFRRAGVKDLHELMLEIMRKSHNGTHPRR